MKNFLLNSNEKYIIKLFGFWHIFLMLFILCVVYFIVKNKSKLINLNSKKKKKIRIVFTIILILNLFIRRGAFLIYNVYDFHFHLDINICNFLNIIYIIYGLTGNSKIYPICFYLSFVGPFIAILFPCINFSVLNYSYYSFLITHHFVFIFNFIFLYFENYKYISKDFKNIFLFLTIYFFIVYCFNYIFNTSYLLPFEFVNNDLLTNGFINYIYHSRILIYFIYFSFIFSLLFLSRSILKKIN